MRRILLLAGALLSIAAPAFAGPVEDVRQIMAGTVTTKTVKQAYLSGARDGTAAFQGALAAYKAVRAAEPAPTVKCADGSVITAPGACPAPPPVVTPPPALTLGGHAKAITTCQSLTNVADVLTLNAIYTVVGFAGYSPIGTVTSPTTREVVVLNDATHLGDGWFGIYVPVSCVAPAA
jgi:hypothetical protein